MIRILLKPCKDRRPPCGEWVPGWRPRRRLSRDAICNQCRLCKRATNRPTEGASHAAPYNHVNWTPIKLALSGVWQGHAKPEPIVKSDRSVASEDILGCPADFLRHQPRGVLGLSAGPQQFIAGVNVCERIERIPGEPPSRARVVVSVAVINQIRLVILALGGEPEVDWPWPSSRWLGRWRGGVHRRGHTHRLRSWCRQRL